MLTEYGVLKPDVPRAGWQAETYEQWRLPKKQQEQEEWERFFAQWREIAIPHDPFWREKFLSIQGIMDAARPQTFNPRVGNHWFWMGVEFVFCMSIAAWIIGGFLLMARGWLWW